MSARANPTFEVSPERAGETDYDVVIVGSGVSGAIIAKQLSAGGARVLVMEAGSGKDITIGDYEESVQRFYAAVSKDNNAAYAENRERAHAARATRRRSSARARRTTAGYFVQNGPFEIDSTYARVLGGTTRHWEAKALRMLPDDFALRTPLRPRARLAARL